MTDKATTDKDSPLWHDLVLPLAEFLLTVLPLIVLTIVELGIGKPLQVIMSSPEWSFGAAVLFGLTVFKLVIAVVKARAGAWERVGLLVVLLIVLGLVPSLVVLALCLSITEPPRGLLVAQCVMFVLASITFLLFGGLAHDLLFNTKSD